jgi:predicted secreted protein
MTLELDAMEIRQEPVSNEENKMQLRFRVILATLASLAIPATACAGDVAQLEILGFSKNGSVFAFEEYGVQDGSGFPYANRYYIDTANDTFVKGTPIRVRLDDESASLETARKQARDKGQTIVGASELAANRGFTAGFNPVTELSADPHRIVVNPRPVFPPIDPALEFRLEEMPMSGGANCDGLETAGFRLLRIDAHDGGETKRLHEDKTIPQSRGCPNGYSIGAVQTFSPSGLSAYAVLIAVRGRGFEGPDYRWIAVTGRP